jgi:hypothetical protein
MANDGLNEFRITMLENQIADVLVRLDEMRKEYATKADVAALNERVDRLGNEVKEWRIECAARFAAIEARLDAIEAILPTLVTKEEFRAELKAEISSAFNRGIAIMITVQCALNGGLYMLLRHAN